MAATLLAMFKRPRAATKSWPVSGSATDAEHMPLIEQVPGLRVDQGRGGDAELRR